MSRAEHILFEVDKRISFGKIGRLHTASGRKDMVGDAARHIKSKTGKGWPTQGGVSDAKKSFVSGAKDKMDKLLSTDLADHKMKAKLAVGGAAGLAAGLAAKKVRDRRRRKRQNEDKEVIKDAVKRMPYYQKASIGAAGLAGAIAAKRAEKRWKESREDY